MDVGGQSWPKIAACPCSAHKKKPPPHAHIMRWGSGVFDCDMQRGILVLGRPGSDLLSQGLSHSTIGAEEFNGRVRDGIGFKLLARTTRPAKDKDTKQAKTRNAFERSPRA